MVDGLDFFLSALGLGPNVRVISLELCFSLLRVELLYHVLDTGVLGHEIICVSRDERLERIRVLDLHTHLLGSRQDGCEVRIVSSKGSLDVVAGLSLVDLGLDLVQLSQSRRRVSIQAQLLALVRLVELIHGGLGVSSRQLGILRISLEPCAEGLAVPLATLVQSFLHHGTSLRSLDAKASLVLRVSPRTSSPDRIFLSGLSHCRVSIQEGLVLLAIEFNTKLLAQRLNSGNGFINTLDADLLLDLVRNPSHRVVQLTSSRRTHTHSTSGLDEVLLTGVQCRVDLSLACALVTKAQRVFQGSIRSTLEHGLKRTALLAEGVNVSATLSNCRGHVAHL